MLAPMLSLSHPGPIPVPQGSNWRREVLGRENLSITFLLLETRLEEKAELRSGTEPARMPAQLSAEALYDEGLLSYAPL